MTCRQGRTKKLYSLHLTCFTVFSSESCFVLVLIRAFQTLFISGSFCISSPKGWRLQWWALPVAAAEGSRGFCPCFQRETATLVRVSDATFHSLVYILPRVLPENYGHYVFMSGHELQYLRDQYAQISCCYYQGSRNPR